MNGYKKFCLDFLQIFLLIYIGVFALCVLLYIYDPLQVWHKPYFREITFIQNARIQAKGIIKNYNFDSFILGTSMLENTLSKEVEQKLCNKWVNISTGGFAFNERAVILKYILKHTKPKNIVYSLDIGYLVTNHTNDTENFGFLYDDNQINDLKIYLNTHTILCAMKFSTSRHCVGTKKLGNLISWLWINNTSHRARFGGIQKWLENSENEQITNTIKELSNMIEPTPYNPKPFSNSIKTHQKYITNNLLIFARQNSNTQFSIIIPTYSRLFYRLNDKIYPQAKVILKWLANETANLKNIKIYGFDDLSYADEIANYKDLTHYNVDMNSMQIDAIANATHILTAENIDEYLQTMEHKIKSYDLASLLQKIKQWKPND